MDRTEFQGLLTEYTDKALMSVGKRRDAALREIARAEWVNDRITSLMSDDEGVSLARADRAAHAAEKHREYQREVAHLSYEAERWDRLARALSFQLAFEIGHWQRISDQAIREEVTA